MGAGSNLWSHIIRTVELSQTFLHIVFVEVDGGIHQLLIHLNLVAKCPAHVKMPLFGNCLVIHWNLLLAGIIRMHLRRDGTIPSQQNVYSLPILIVVLRSEDDNFSTKGKCRASIPATKQMSDE